MTLKWKWWFALKTSWPTRSIKINLQYKTFSVLYILLWLWNAHFEQLNHESSHPSPSPPTGGAGFLANLRGHPRGLGQDGGIPGGRAGQRWAAGQADGPAEGVDVESDPGERPVPFPKSPRCQRSSTPPRGEGHQRSHLSRTGCWPASQSLFFILFITVITGTALSDKEQITHWKGERENDLGSAVCTKRLDLCSFNTRFKNLNTWVSPPVYRGFAFWLLSSKSQEQEERWQSSFLVSGSETHSRLAKMRCVETPRCETRKRPSLLDTTDKF